MSQTIVEKMVESIATDIFRGVYAPGDRLPAYRKIAEQYDTTLPTAQRAVGRIQELGLVEVRRGSGATVLDPITTVTPGVIPYWVSAILDDPDQACQLVDDFLEVRRELASMLVVRLDRANAEELALIADAIDAMQATVTSGAPVNDVMEADLAVIRAMLTVQQSIALATIFNAFAGLLHVVPELPRAMYTNPALNVTGYRGALRMVDADVDPDTIRGTVMSTMKPLDQTTLRNFRRELEA